MMAPNYRNLRIPQPPRPEPYAGPPSTPLLLPQGDVGEVYAMELLTCLEPTHVMEKHGYAMKQLTNADLNQKRRCCKCNLTVAQLTRGLKKTLQYWLDNPHTAPKPLPTVEVSVDNGFPNVQPCNSLCVFHPGTVVRGTKCWDCCDQHVSEPTPCGISSVHVLRKFDPVHLDRLYQMYDTPPVYNAQQENCPIRDAVSIDCEMGTAETGDPELIRVSAVDYFTGEILVNNIVNPDQPMQHLNTKYSGVTWGQMNHALRSRKALEGKAGARDALWRFVGPNTILVGHAVNNDLRALRWIHPRVVDSFMIEYKIVQARKEAEATAAVAAAKEKAGKEAEQEAERQLLGLPARPMTDGSTPPLTVHGKFTQGTLAVPEPKKKKPKGSGDLALKTLMKKYLGKDVQMQGNKGHDSLEDAVAARDLVHWMIMRRLARHPVNAEDFDGMN